MWEIAMAERKYVAPRDKYAADRQEAEKLNLEMHVRIEAGLVDTIDPKSAPRPMPALRSAEGPSLWQALKKFFH